MNEDTETLEAIYREGPRWMDTAEAAKLIRAQLKRSFPGYTFRVRTKRYAGGSSIDVSWVDGPTERQVRAVTEPFSGQHFDGMIDMAYGSSSWLLPDGSATFASTKGTGGSMGSVPGFDLSRPHPDAILFHTGCYVFAQRDCSPAFLAQLEPMLPVNVDGWERDQWRYRTSQNYAGTLQGTLEDVSEG